MAKHKHDGLSTQAVDAALRLYAVNIDRGGGPPPTSKTLVADAQEIYRFLANPGETGVINERNPK